MELIRFLNMRPNHPHGFHVSASEPYIFCQVELVQCVTSQVYEEYCCSKNTGLITKASVVLNSAKG